MVFERTENEPEEYDPEAELTDPESDSLTIPEVSTDETDVPPEILKTFWAIVLVVNAAVLAFSLGVLFLVFDSDVSTGGPLLGGGVILFGFAVYRYLAFRRSADEFSGDASDVETDSAPDPSPSHSSGSTAAPPDKRSADSDSHDSADADASHPNDHDRHS